MSTIEWTQETKNITIGCDEVSPGCLNCYAKNMAYRLAHIPAQAENYAGLTKKLPNGKIVWTGAIKLMPQRLTEILQTKKPTTFFINSMSDIFHKDVPYSYVDKLLAVAAVCPQHTFQILTKRADRMHFYFYTRLASIISELNILGKEHPHLFDLASSVAAKLIMGAKWQVWKAVFKNVWMGVSVENQKAADERIPHLLNIPAAVRWLSCEPLLGPVNLSRYIDNYEEVLHWVVCGGESGHGARPMHPDWARSLRDQCSAANIPFFFKQWGEWYTTWYSTTDNDFSFKMFDNFQQWTQKSWVHKGDACISIDGTLCKQGSDFQKCAYPVAIMQKPGKQTAGRLLDGVLHDAYPTVQSI